MIYATVVATLFTGLTFGQAPTGDDLEGSCVVIHDFIPNKKYIKNTDCNEDDDDCTENNAVHDFFVEVWLNSGKLETGKKRTHVKYNTAEPEWQESLCWQSRIESVNFNLYEDDSYAGEDEEYFVNQMTPEEAKANVKRKSKADLKIALYNGDSQNIGTLRYSIEVDSNLWGLGAAKGCTPESMLLEVTEPDFFRPLKGGWINSNMVQFDDDAIEIERYDQNPCEADFQKGQFLQRVVLFKWVAGLDCSPEEVTFAVEEAGGKGVIFSVPQQMEPQMEAARQQAAEAPLASIPARWVTAVERVDLDRTWDVHNIEKIKVKMMCPWEYEQEFMGEGMCASDVWFAGKYSVMKASDENGEPTTVVVNDHAVFVTNEDDFGAPVYFMNLKSRTLDTLGEYRWMVVTSLSGDRTIAECVTGTKIGETMEPNDCEHWKVYDQQFGAWEDVLYTILDFCDAGTGKDNNDKCSHTQNQFVITSAGGNEFIEKAYWSVIALFGPARYETADDLEIVFLTGDNFEGCDEYGKDTLDVHGDVANVRGKIVMVSRGRCYFTVKQVNAENAGAAAVIVVNYEDTPELYMAHSGTTAPGSIPIRMLQYKDGQSIKDFMERLKPEVFKGGFLCPEDFDSPPSAVCATAVSHYTHLGYYNDFHGTFRREPNDFNEHAVYRLDALTNQGTDKNQWGTQTTGEVGEGIDHTNTYLYYDAGGVDDVGNAWKIGPEIGGGKQHIYAYCQGALGADMSSPVNCDTQIGKEGQNPGMWFTYKPKENAFWGLNTGVYLDQNNQQRRRRLFFDGACPWDLATGDKWHENDAFDGIFCTKHEECQPNEYCMDCKACLALHEDGDIFQKDALKHPCGNCMYGRDVANKADDGQCMPNVECNIVEGEMNCKNRCAIEEIGIKGNCPKFPGCKNTCPKDVGLDKNNIWGDGDCNFECAGCPSWQTEEAFDGGDCDDRDSFLEADMEFEFTGKEGMINMVCVNHYNNQVLYKTENIFEMFVKEVQGSKFEMVITYKQKSASDSQFAIKQPVKLTVKGIEESVTEWTGQVTEVDKKTPLKIIGFSGTMGKDKEKYGSDSNPEGFFVTVTPEAGADGWNCKEFLMPMTGKAGDNGGGDSGESDEMKACKEKSKGQCKGECAWFSTAKPYKSPFCQKKENKKEKECKKIAKRGACLHTPNRAPERGQCFLEDPKIFIKGKAYTEKFQGDEARNMQPCDCTDWCILNYGQENQKYVAMSLRKEENNKGKLVAFCDCFYSVKKLLARPDKKGKTIVTGNLVGGFLSNFDVSE